MCTKTVQAFEKQAIEKNKPVVDMHINCYIGYMIGSFA